MDAHEKEIAARQVDAIVALTTTVAQLRTVVELLHASVTQLVAAALRLEGKIDVSPAE